MATTAPAPGGSTGLGRHRDASADATSAVVDDPRPEVPSPHRVRRVPWPAVTAGATAVAGGLHLAAAADHLGAGDLVVAFFGLTGFAQLSAAVVLLMPLVGPTAARTRHLLALTGLLGTAALIALYVVVHSTDLLSGLLEHSGAGTQEHAAGEAGHDGHASVSTPAPEGPEPTDALGTATVAVEVLALCGFVALLPARWSRLASNGLLVVGVLAWALWLSGALS